MLDVKLFVASLYNVAIKESMKNMKKWRVIDVLWTGISLKII